MHSLTYNIRQKFKSTQVYMIREYYMLWYSIKCQSRLAQETRKVEFSKEVSNSRTQNNQHILEETDSEPKVKGSIMLKQLIGCKNSWLAAVSNFFIQIDTNNSGIRELAQNVRGQMFCFKFSSVPFLLLVSSVFSFYCFHQYFHR